MSNRKELQRRRRHARIRSKIAGNAKKPRLVVFRSLTHTYAQLVNDEKHKVLASSSDLKLKVKGSKLEKAKAVGAEIAKKALENKIETCVFDRNGYKFHGRVKALADSAREAGLKF